MCKNIRPARSKSGVAILYISVAMTIFAGFVSLAIDVAHVRLVKVELQQSADAAALSAGEVLLTSSSSAQSNAVAAAALNYADGTSVVVNPSTDVVYGTWNASTATFTPSSGWSSSVNAVKVYCRRTAATSNAVQMTFARILGLVSQDVIASSVAYVSPATTTTVTISGKDDPWLAGMPSGSTASYDDTAPAEDPIQVTGITVTPGTYITLTNISGSVSHGPSIPADGPTGNTGQIYDHGADSPGGPTPAVENGIGNIYSPIDALLGVFLTNAQPNQSGVSTPATRDYSSAASQNQNSYDDLELQQPFYIGNGTTTSGTVQQFKVPAGATRLFLGPMDGHEWENNTGSFTATVSTAQTVELVQ